MICFREPKDRNVSKYIKYGEHVDQEKNICTSRQRGFDDI